MAASNHNVRNVHLDFARGCAALVVCASHLRAFHLPTFSQLESPTFVDKVVYLFTGFGHQAVIVFFVLSGYFIGGSVADSFAAGRWSWLGYGLRRLTRLWIVLIPALALTWFWDRLGIWISDGVGYDGQFRIEINSGPEPSSPIDRSFLTLLGNMTFLQGIAVPDFGTNSPLWSLANEFWYYVLFPLLLSTLWGRASFVQRAASGGIALGILAVLPATIIVGFGIWLLGLLVFLALKPVKVRFLLGHPLAFAFSCILLGAALWQSRTGGILGSDFVVGAGFAGVMPLLILRQPLNRLYTRIATFLSEISYTLYVMHFPVYAFLFFSFRLPLKSSPGFGAYAMFTVLICVALLYAWALWWCFEKRTSGVRRWLEVKILSGFR